MACDCGSQSSDFSKAEEELEAGFTTCEKCTTEAECKANESCKKGYTSDEETECATQTCPPGFEEKGGVCVKVSTEISIDKAEASVEASTGRSVIRISGIAFHEGINKNGWGLTREGAEYVANAFVGVDLTLNHPEPDALGFSRNMDGGIDEAVVGIVREATVVDSEAGWEVRYIADVYRTELFEALESGLWLRDGYGVSIGGTGTPERVVESEEGVEMWFGAGFEIDHLAIVHRPAYPGANIETAEKVELPATADEGFKYDSQPTAAHKVTEMTSDEDIQEDETLVASEDLQAQLVLANARIAEFEAAQEAAAEEARMELVNKASELGMNGHEELSSATLTNLIASWEEAHPPVPEVEMAPIASTTESPVTADVEAPSGKVIANFLNGEKVETPESAYAACYNRWVAAWNGHLQGDEGSMRAQTYEQIKEMI